jgi:hypothetical protein
MRHSAQIAVKTLTEFLVAGNKRELIHDDVVGLLCELDTRDGVAQRTHRECVFRLQDSNTPK